MEKEVDVQQGQMTRIELEERIQTARESIGEFTIAENILSDQYLSLQSQRHSTVSQQLMEELTAEHDRFACIFETEIGSRYFLLQSGASFRIQRKKLPKNPTDFARIIHKEYSLTKIFDQIFFVNSEIANLIQSVLRGSRDETNTHIENSEYNFDERLIGRRPLERNTQTQSICVNDIARESSHLGHAITKILYPVK